MINRVPKSGLFYNQYYMYNNAILYGIWYVTLSSENLIIIYKMWINEKLL